MADLAKKESELIAKGNKAQEGARRAGSASSVNSKLREAERALKDLSDVQRRKADIAKKVETKTRDLHRFEERLAKEEAQHRKKLLEEDKRQMREREALERRITAQLRSQKSLLNQELETGGEMNELEYDFFISHASEDKEGFVRNLATALQNRGAKIWYDEFSLKVGDSLRRNIDSGLRNSKFGVVVFSEHFFRKEWPNRELDGLTTKEVDGTSRILPIWHKVSKDEVARYSPTLADRVALNTSIKSVDEIVDELMQLIS